MNAANEMRQPPIRMTKALLKCLSDSRDIPFLSFIFIHFEAEGTYRFSHSPSSPVSRKRKILRNAQMDFEMK